MQKTNKKGVPGPSVYDNTNEIMHNYVMKNPGQTHMGTGQRKIDFPKYAALHSELIEKGLH